MSQKGAVLATPSLQAAQVVRSGNAEPTLSELLGDPIMHHLMIADRVNHRDLLVVLQRARRFVRQSVRVNVPA